MMCIYPRSNTHISIEYRVNSLTLYEKGVWGREVPP